MRYKHSHWEPTQGGGKRPHQLRGSHGLSHAARGPPLRGRGLRAARLRRAQGQAERRQHAWLRGRGRQERQRERGVLPVGGHACHALAQVPAGLHLNAGT